MSQRYILPNVLRLSQAEPLYVAVVLCFAIILYRLSFIGDDGLVSGADGGNWLALGHELFGQKIKAATTTYPPVVPSLVKGLSLFLSPVVAITTVGAVASVLAGIPFFLLARQTIGPNWAFLFTVGFLFVGASVETAAFGAYPQLFSQAFLLSTLYWLGKGLYEDRLSYVFFGSISASLSIWTWMPGLMFLVVTTPLFVGLITIGGNFRLTFVLSRSVIWVVLVAIISLGALPFYSGAIEILSSRSWNPQGFSSRDITTAFAITFREWPSMLTSPLVLLPLIAGLGFYCVTRGRGSILAVAAASLMLSSLVIFIGTSEVRTLNILALSIMGALAFVFFDVFTWMRRLPLNGDTIRIARIGIAVLALGIVALQVKNSHDQTDAIFRYYQVLNQDVVESLDWLRDNVPRNAVIVASGNEWGFHYSWWIEGYSGLPTYSATDDRSFFYEEEKEQTAVANALLFSRSSTTIAKITALHDINYVFLDKGAFNETPPFIEAGFLPVFENASILVLFQSSMMRPY